MVQKKEPSTTQQPKPPQAPGSAEPGDVLPPNDEVVRVERQERFGLQVESYHSDTLPPRVIEEFIRIIPGSGPEFVEQMKARATDRRAIELQRATRAERRLVRGQIFGFGIAALSLICGTVITIHNQTYAGAFIGFMFALVGVGGPAVARILAVRAKPPTSPAGSGGT